MELSTWFDYQLRSTLDGFMWSVRQLPAERFYNIPPVSLGLGEWSAAQHVFHMLQYEEGLVLPSMLQWLGGPPVTRRENQSEDLPPIEATLAQFERIRHEEIALLTKFSQEIWESKQKTTFWGEVSLAWLVSKTYQHTLEHTHDILSLNLFWDRRLARVAQGS